MLKPLTRRTLSEEVVGRIRNYILSNGIQSGSRLPTETQLATELDVSRNTVREALKSLEAIGAVERRPRRGAILQDVDLGRTAEVSQFLMLRSAKDLDDLFIARRVMELSLLDLVADNAAEEDFLEMEKANQLMESEIADGGSGTDGDVAFHEALVRASKNKFLIQFSNIVQVFIREVHSRSHMGADTNKIGCEEHRQITSSLRKGDIKTAEHLLREHIDRNIALGIVHPYIERIKTT